MHIARQSNNESGGGLAAFQIQAKDWRADFCGRALNLDADVFDLYVVFNAVARSFAPQA